MADLFLRHVALSIPDADIEKAEKFYTDFGLRFSRGSEESHAFCQDLSYPSIKVFHGAAAKKLHHVELGASSKVLATIADNMKSLKINPEPAPDNCPAEGIWVKDPWGTLYHITEATDAYQVNPVPPFFINAPGHCNRFNKGALPPKSTIPVIRPRKLGHVLLFTPDVEGAFTFLEQVFGMKLSDRAGDGVAFVHCPGGSDHHVIAFAKAPAVGFHHASFLVGSPDEVGVGGDRMIQNGHTKHWGFGRHAIGSNFFHYIADPWGSYLEYYSDMDYIQDSDNWTAKNWPAEDALHTWGPVPPADFVTNYEVEDKK